MKKFHLDSFFIVEKFKYHEQVKNNLLDLISKVDSQTIISPSAEVNITRCDWCVSTDFNRNWFIFIKNLLFENLIEIYSQLGYDGFTLNEIWFQQYLTNAGHGWHTHSGNFTSVYYLELPIDAPKTQLISPYDQKSIIELNVSEGDIVIFPSYVIHKAPINSSQSQKTIISFNTNATYSDAIYGKNLGDHNAIL